MSNRKKQHPYFSRHGKGNGLVFSILIALACLLWLLFVLSGKKSKVVPIPYSEFLVYLERGVISEVRITDSRLIKGKLSQRPDETENFKTVIPYYDEGLMERLKEQGTLVIGRNSPPDFLFITLQILPWVVGFALLGYYIRSSTPGDREKISHFGKSRAKKYEKKRESVSFDDVAGHQEAKYELQEVVAFLKKPSQFTHLGARIPKGILIAGEPGTGKTLLARAVAGEAGVAFFHLSGSDFVEMFAGVGARRVRDLFRQGRKHTPCILFIDELDSVGRVRSYGGYGGGHDEREQTLNQLLVELDGFEPQSGVVVIAATNRPDVLDPALLRPGRFDRRVFIDMPDLGERLAILKVHCKKVKLDEGVDLKRIARTTSGTSGADIASLINEAALFAARKGKMIIDMADFEEASDKVLLGTARKSRTFTPQEIRITAYHEAGHALLHYHVKHADALRKVSIIPRGQALGVTASLPESDRCSLGKNWLEDTIRLSLGGYVSEELIFGETSTGVRDDIEKAFEIAQRMVCDWGMGPRGPILSKISRRRRPNFSNRGSPEQPWNQSEETIREADREILAILHRCLKDVREILQREKAQLILLAEKLIECETMDDIQVRRLLNLEVRGESLREA